MKKSLLVLATVLCVSISFGQNIGLFFSEYAEGTSNNKYLEIYNGTGAPVDLGNFSLSSCSNGCNVVGEFDFPDNVVFAPGTIVAPGDVYIIAHPSANPTILAVADQTFTFLSNGDDIFALTFAGATASNYEIIDIIGDLQGDPGTGWSVAGTANGTVDHTLVRNPNVCIGNPVPLASFGTSPIDSEWLVGGVDDWTAIDIHFTTCTGCSTTFGTLTDSGCDSYNSQSGNQTWTASGNYRDTIPSLISGTCDSVIFVNLTINTGYTGITDAVTICDGTNYTFGTQTLSIAGVYNETFTAANGCDSTVELTLSTVTSYTTNLTESICAGQTYTLGAQSLTTTGMYSELFTSTLGCDSTVNLDLTVLTNSTNAFPVTACDSYTVPSGDETYFTGGTYNDTIPSANGCDSVLTITLTIGTSNLIEFTETACDFFVFEGNNYTTSGMYDVMFTNINNCDSIRRLHLTITPTPGAPSVTASQDLCDGDIPSDITASTSGGSDLIISGVLDGPLPGGLPKCVEFYAINDISDLSVYGFGSANNGAGSNGVEFVFPAVAIMAGDYYRVGTDSLEFNNFFGYYPNEADSWAGNINGDDAIELFLNNALVDAFGDSLVDGTGQPWEYLDGWAYRINGTTPNGGTFNPADWTYSGINALDGELTNGTAVTPFPDGTFTTPSSIATFNWYDDAGLSNLIGSSASITPGTGIGTQDFYVTATVNGCTSASAHTSVTINALPAVDAGVGQTVCEEDMITLSGAGALFYVWDNSVVNNTAFAATVTTTYTVVGTDPNGCANSDQVTVTVNPLPAVTYSEISMPCVYDSPITLAAGSPASGTYAGTGVSGNNFNPATAGVGTHTITYSYTDGNGCTNSASDDIVVDACAGITDPDLGGGLLAFPNPTVNTVTIVGLDDIENTINVTDTKGRTLRTLVVNAPETTIDVHDLASGQYLVTIENTNGINVIRLIKE